MDAPISDGKQIMSAIFWHISLIQWPWQSDFLQVFKNISEIFQRKLFIFKESFKYWRNFKVHNFVYRLGYLKIFLKDTFYLFWLTFQFFSRLFADFHHLPKHCYFIMCTYFCTVRIAYFTYITLNQIMVRKYSWVVGMWQQKEIVFRWGTDHVNYYLSDN